MNERAGEGELVIKPVTLEDVPAIVGIDAEVTGSAKADFWYGCYARQNTDAKCRFLVAHRDGEVAGYTFGAIQAWEFGSPPCGWVEVISVAPQYRNAHVATKLSMRSSRISATMESTRSGPCCTSTITS
ncbi:MAG: GNAT family N-acetyltransferase [Tepidamorphaceae bacterium]